MCSKFFNDNDNDNVNDDDDDDDVLNLDVLLLPLPHNQSSPGQHRHALKSYRLWQKPCNRSINQSINQPEFQSQKSTQPLTVQFLSKAFQIIQAVSSNHKFQSRKSTSAPSTIAGFVPFRTVADCQPELERRVHYTLAATHGKEVCKASGRVKGSWRRVSGSD